MRITDRVETAYVRARLTYSCHVTPSVFTGAAESSSWSFNRRYSAKYGITVYPSPRRVSSRQRLKVSASNLFLYL